MNPFYSNYQNPVIDMPLYGMEHYKVLSHFSTIVLWFYSVHLHVDLAHVHST